MNLKSLSEEFRRRFGKKPTHAARAPGRVEVLGNHTDYNEGFVVSAAIDTGIFCLCRRSAGKVCRIFDPQMNDEVSLNVSRGKPLTSHKWANYVLGVLFHLRGHGRIDRGFDAMIAGNVPIGSGLSSSAALEMSSVMALSSLYDIHLDKLTMAKIGQSAEHEFAGAKCGLLDQISSLWGKRNQLVFTDFRTMEVRTLPISADAMFLLAVTGVKHALVEGEYNVRRAACERAAKFFAESLPHPVSALRDVSLAELRRHAEGMDSVTARRAEHVIGENDRVLRGGTALEGGKLAEFGKLMFESHESSRILFENSCPELDFLVDTARRIPEVLGARLSGGGFGGSAVLLLHPSDAAAVGEKLASAYNREYGHPCEIRLITPSAGAKLLAVPKGKQGNFSQRHRVPRE